MKSPAFQFYPNDFLGSPAVRGMSTEEVGIYLLLLCADWNADGFAFDAKKLAKVCNVAERKFRRAWEQIEQCFERCEDGRWRNPRLQREREKQLTYSERMSENGKKGGRPKAVAKPRVSGEKAAAKPNESIAVPSPTTTTPSRKREAGEVNWVSRLAAEFKEAGGTVREGHLGQALKPAHERFGETVLRTAMGLWLSERKANGWSCAFPKFAADHVRWCEEAVKLRDAAMSGVDYWDNEALQRITRPSLVA